MSACNPRYVKRRILVFRIGQLGDTIVALPAMWAIRHYFASAELTLLCDQHPGKNHVWAADLLRGTGIFDRYESYPVGLSEAAGRSTTQQKTLLAMRLRRIKHMGLLAMRLRRRNFDTLAYLAPSIRTAAQIERDRRFFRLAGIRNFIGMTGFTALPKKVPGQPLSWMPSEADLLLQRLAADGIQVPKPQSGSLELNLNRTDGIELDAWLGRQTVDNGKPWVGIGPGSKMSAKRWPVERFERVVAQLIDNLDIWPIVFGGSEDKEVAQKLLSAWGRGYNAAGDLSLRAAALALNRCSVYIGNDTGTMHLAAAVKTPCVAIFSARHPGGAWSPYGSGHHVFQAQIECEGCLLTECIEKDNECLRMISVKQVFDASSDILRSRTVSGAQC